MCLPLSTSSKILPCSEIVILVLSLSFREERLVPRPPLSLSELLLSDFELIESSLELPLLRLDLRLDLVLFFLLFVCLPFFFVGLRLSFLELFLLLRL